MKILMIYPKYPDTFWGFKYALKFIFKKATHPPLGLLTVSSMLPAEWEQRLIDLNVSPLLDQDVKWADLVFISAMTVQQKSVRDIIDRCRRLETKIVAGGPLFTSGHEQYPGVDYFVLNEAELTLPAFLRDLAQGRPQPVYTSAQWADLSLTPAPNWKLIRLKHYATMVVQYSRGCPFNCDFCDITLLFGHRCRTKTREQVLAEMENLHALGWRGGVFFVDDNFIGNKQKLKQEILPAMAEWMAQRKHPFMLSTQASVDLADDSELLRLMARAGFETVFVGIETPHEESLAECTKVQNKNRDLVACVKKIQNAGLQVQGGFIVGFDQDPASIFERQIHFIQKSGIVTAMVGLLNALQGTRLYQRLKTENRLIRDISGDNTDCSINFIPKMNYETLIAGYKSIVAKIYSPKYFYARIKEFLQEYKPVKLKRAFRIDWGSLSALVRSFWRLGIVGKERLHYWKLLLWSVMKHPRSFRMAVTLAIFGFHYRKVFEKFE